MDKDTYFCNKCREEWNFFPEDFCFVEEDYPVFCPFCVMPVSEMIKDVWKLEKFKGIPLIIKLLFCRFK